MMPKHLKNDFFRAASLLSVDSLFRFINRNKLLVVMYHGITQKAYDPPVWTQLPVDQFRRQLDYLQKHYQLVSLSRAIEALCSGKPLPDRAALITFDDGLKNNFTVAFSLLVERAIPAAIFLTADYIGTENILWVDELYLILREAPSQGVSLKCANAAAQKHFQAGQIWKSYEILVEELKRSGKGSRDTQMDSLRKTMPVNHNLPTDDFGMLDWNEVRSMHQSGLIEFGVHTATHRILSELTPNEWDEEIAAPKHRLEKEIGATVSAFCYPNGRPNIDFRQEHLEYLHQSGYFCAFTTDSILVNPKSVDPMCIGRIPAGNDGSRMNYFRLNTSGFVEFLRAAVHFSKPNNSGIRLAK